MSATVQPRAARRAPRGWWPLLVLSLLIAAYGASYLLRGQAAFGDELGDSFRARPWGIFSHAFFGAMALLTGPFQFRRDLLGRRRAIHRITGRVYVGAALGIGVSGLYMAAYSFGGAGTHLGFGLLAVLTLATTGTAFARIRVRDVAAHREWMVRSFALIFAAVTLRIELPLLIAAHGGQFPPAYQWVAWTSWLPNLLWAEWYVRRSRGLVAVPAHVGAAA